MIETLDDIIEDIANMVGAYGCGPEDEGHEDNCQCRLCFTQRLHYRIHEAVRTEHLLSIGLSIEATLEGR